jgi:large subunit ribosomal protein L28
MASKCIVTGKGTISGNHVAHCNKKVKRNFKSNVHKKRFWVPEENRFVRLAVSSSGIRIIDKRGIHNILLMLRARGEKI